MSTVYIYIHKDERTKTKVVCTKWQLLCKEPADVSIQLASGGVQAEASGGVQADDPDFVCMDKDTGCLVGEATVVGGGEYRQ